MEPQQKIYKVKEGVYMNTSKTKSVNKSSVDFIITWEPVIKRRIP